MYVNQIDQEYFLKIERIFEKLKILIEHLFLNSLWAICKMLEVVHELNYCSRIEIAFELNMNILILHIWNRFDES